VVKSSSEDLSLKEAEGSLNELRAWLSLYTMEDGKSWSTITVAGASPVVGELFFDDIIDFNYVFGLEFYFL